MTVTGAVLDPASDRSYCTQKLADQLRAKGRPVCLSISTLKSDEEADTEEIRLKVTSLRTRKKRSIIIPRVVVVERLPSTLPSAAANVHDVIPWKHLHGTAPWHGPKEVDLLIGQDVPQALLPLEIRRGRYGEPFAVRTTLGWTINGPLGPLPVLHGNNAISQLSKAQMTLPNMHPEYFWDHGPMDLLDNDQALSIEDRRVLRLWEATTTQVKGHYQFPIPFRQEEPGLPDNKMMAERRLFHLRQRLLKDKTLAKGYQEEMRSLLAEGHAERVPRHELEARPGATWYLPHHPVLSANKPGKVRIVFDCAATCKAVSLNSQVMQGPDLNNKLVDILFRFRQRRVALMADVEAMFHQVRVVPEHRDALRFLWWIGPQMSGTPTTYRMNVHLFGGIWSPSAAGYALQRTFQDHGKNLHEEVKRARHNFYVDDLLLSVSTPEKAIIILHRLRQTLNKGGFRLTKWLCNHKDVLRTVPETERAAGVKEVFFDDDRLPVERALGILWDLEKDELGIRVQVPEKPETKRGLLSTISSLYDPLGIVAPAVIPAKLLFQTECRREAEWDEPITEEGKTMWRRWLTELPHLTKVRIPRWYAGSVANPKSIVQLHHFCDASQRAYGAVSYLRITTDEGQHLVSFVTGKAKLAPLKQQTIPRLELCAAVLAARLDTQLKRALELEIKDSVFWTDSTAVLQYIRNTRRRFHTFVANRVAAIHEATKAEQWRHVSSADNPADDASRGMWGTEMAAGGRWIQGPPFLKKDEKYWPKYPYPISEIGDTDPEVKKEGIILVAKINKSAEVLEKICAHPSSWFQLKRNVAWLRKFIRWRCNLSEEGQVQEKDRLSVAELDAAGLAILRLVQERHFTRVLTSLRGGHPLQDNTVAKLEPFLDADGLIKVGGRLRHALLHPEQRNPILLPREARVTELIIREVHETKTGHSGREYTLSRLRERFWIPKSRKLIDKITRTCVTCRRINWISTKQRHADLPEDRVRSGDRPFTYTGVDCFGPFLIKQGRTRTKRWGCLFTCLVSRAIHLELLAALDGDSFINAVTRFAARRGPPRRVRSDNGTNITGANRELREAVQAWNCEKGVQNALLQKQIEWEFNPPTASHMGGVWERQIRTVKKVLQAVIGEQVLDEERLHTIFCAVEDIVNGRPITPVSTDVNDLEALTPHHLLRSGPDTLSVGGEYSIGETYRRRWKHAQFIADQFWKRWTNEYLPTLRQRQRRLTTPNLQAGDIVIVSGQPLPRQQWRLGRILETVPGDDGVVRSARVKTKDSVMLRPVTRLCLLEGVAR